MILHRTGPHFGTERSEVERGLIAWAPAQGPRLVVLSGDITQRARAAQFAAANAFLPIALCPPAARPRAHVQRWDWDGGAFRCVAQTEVPRRSGSGAWAISA